MRLMSLLTVLLLSGLADAAPADSVVLTYWGQWTIEQGIDGLERAHALGARNVTVLVHLCQTSKNSADVRYCYDGGRDLPFDVSYQGRRLDALQSAATARGMSLNLMPFLIVEDGSGRHYIWPDDRDAWFSAYGDKIVELANYARTFEHASYILASELSSTYVFDVRWRRLIDRVRAVYAGHLTISTIVGLHATVLFWDALDSIGVSAYFPLSPAKALRSQTVLDTAWRSHKVHLLAQSAVWSKPVTFVELGYPTTDVAAQRPWDWAFAERSYDEELQRRCFEAFRRVWGGDARLRAFQLWGVSNPQIDASERKNFSPVGKPAEATLRAIFRERGALP